VKKRVPVSDVTLPPYCGLVDGWPENRRSHWGDAEWWDAQIDSAVGEPDPVLRNLRITLAHQELSLALTGVTGETTAANFHTWAVWGSKKAGRTIRREDVPWLRRVPVARHSLGVASQRILGGNVTVLDDIGRETARFVCAYPDIDGLLANMPKEHAALAEAYRHYDAASREPDADRRDEHMLLANLLAILHEHRRLEPYIDDSIPRPLRRFVTSRLLDFRVGPESMDVSRDVPAEAGFPSTLRTVESSDLEEFLREWDRTPDTVDGSAAADWTKIADRMNFICDLFRTRQRDPELFAAPYPPRERDEILAGVVPAGPL
jgi:hypothetical protein